MYETYKVKCKWLQTKENFADFIQKKKLRLQGAGMFAMSLTTSKKKEARIQTCVFLSSENILS